jgi:hypothetical protein
MHFFFVQDDPVLYLGSWDVWEDKRRCLYSLTKIISLSAHEIWSFYESNDPFCGLVGHDNA